MNKDIRWRGLVITLGLLLFWIAVVKMIQGQFHVQVFLVLFLGMLCVSGGLCFASREKRWYRVTFFKGEVKHIEYYYAHNFKETRPRGAALTSVTFYPEKITISKVILLQEVEG